MNRSQATDLVKIKILNFFTKSQKAANTFPQAKDVIFDTVFADHAAPKVKGMGMQFFIWLVNQATADSMKLFASEIFNRLLDTVKALKKTKPNSVSERHEVNSAKENLYVALGMLGKKFPEFVSEKLHILQLYFDALDTEEPHVKICIMQGLGSLIYAYQNPRDEIKQQMEDFFLDVAKNVRKIL